MVAIAPSIFSVDFSLERLPASFAGVVSIPVTFSASAKWLKILTEFKQQEKITVGYFDTETLAVKTAEMYVEGYKASLVKDTSRKGLWTVSSTLKEF